MAAKLPADVHEAFHRVVHDFDPDLPTLASLMGIPPGVLYNKANYSTDGYNKPTLADAIVATVLTKDHRILHAFAATVGEVCYRLPDYSAITTSSLLTHLTKIEVEGGDFYREIHSALAEDDRINAREYKDIEKAAHEWIAAVLEGLARMKEMAA